MGDVSSYMSSFRAVSKPKDITSNTSKREAVTLASAINFMSFGAAMSEHRRLVFKSTRLRQVRKRCVFSYDFCFKAMNITEMTSCEYFSQNLSQIHRVCPPLICGMCLGRN